MMRFRLGAVVGFAVGYYLGTKAGRVRYEQIRRTLRRAEPLAKAMAIVELGVERVRSSRPRSEQPPLPFESPVSSN